MEQQKQEFTLRTRSKIAILFMFALIGIPMLYAAFLNFRVQELFMGTLMVGLFIAWALVILKVFTFRVKMTDRSLERKGLFSTQSVSFFEVDTIHFGSKLSDFYVQSEDGKVYISKDFDDHENIIRQVVDRVLSVKDPAEVELAGKNEDIERFAGRSVVS